MSKTTDGAKAVLGPVAALCPRLERIWADGSYAGELVQCVASVLHCVLEIVKRSDDAQGFVVLPHRWIVERTFAWLGKFRRLSKDYERTTASGEAWIDVAMIHLMVRRLAPNLSFIHALWCILSDRGSGGGDTARMGKGVR